MRSSFPVVARALAIASIALATLVACDDDDPMAPEELTGTYVATTFRVTPTGQAAIDVLAEGGSLSVTIASNNAATGTLFIPASATGGQDLTASMSGTVVRSGNTIELQQAADTFVRDLTWTVGATTLAVVNQTAGGASFTITLTRQ